jgi:hypothetical protein
MTSNFDADVLELNKQNNKIIREEISSKYNVTLMLLH